MPQAVLCGERKGCVSCILLKSMLTLQRKRDSKWNIEFVCVIVKLVRGWCHPAQKLVKQQHQCVKSTAPSHFYWPPCPCICTKKVSLEMAMADKTQPIPSWVDHLFTKMNYMYVPESSQVWSLSPWTTKNRLGGSRYKLIEIFDSIDRFPYINHHESQRCRVKLSWCRRLNYTISSPPNHLSRVKLHFWKSI